MLSFDYNRTSYVIIDVNVGVKKHNFKFPLVLDKNNIMTVHVTQKLKFMQNLLLRSM